MANDDSDYIFGLLHRDEVDPNVAILNAAARQQLPSVLPQLPFQKEPSPIDKGVADQQAKQQAQVAEAWRTIGSDAASDKEITQANQLIKKDSLTKAAGVQDWYNQATGADQPAPGSPEDINRWLNLKTGLSARMLQDLGLEYPGVSPTSTVGKWGGAAPQFQSEAPARAIPRAQLVTQPGATSPNAPQSNVGLTQTIGTEFGEVDNPAYGGYTEAGWNVGKWGDPIAGKSTALVALPPEVLRPYGNIHTQDFAKNFNANYDVQVVNPTNGQVTVVPVGDIGPGTSTGAGLDMTWGTREAIGLPQNYKGPVQYRIVPKGSALPDNTTLVSAKGGQTGLAGPTGEVGQAGVAGDVYIKPIDTRKLRDPEVYGKQMTDEDKALWARHQADIYAGQMDDAGSPLTTTEYKKIYDDFYQGTQKKAAGEEPKAPAEQVNSQFGGLANLIPQLDQLKTAHSAALKELGIGMTSIGVSQLKNDYTSQRDSLVGNVAKGIGGNVGALSDQDVKRAQGALPSEWDDEGEAAKKSARLKAAALQQMKTIIDLQSAAHVDTSAMRQIYRNLLRQTTQATQSASQEERAKSIESKQTATTQQPAATQQQRTTQPAAQQQETSQYPEAVAPY